MEKMIRYKQSLSLIDSWLNYQMYINEIYGAAIGIFVEGELIFNKTYGYADFENKTKLTNDHLFRIASQSKLFTATAIMNLIQEGKLALDDKVVKHLDWFESAEDDNLQHITIKHLLTHSSGIQSDTRKGFWSNHMTPDVEEIKALVKKGISIFKVEEILKYSNLGYAILGLIIETASGEKFGDYVQQSILDPLEMDETFMDFSETIRDKLAFGYNTKYPGKNRDRQEHFSTGVIQPAVGMISTVKDLANFFQAHLYGNQSLIPDEIKKEMQSVQFEHNNEKRGLGFWLGQVPNGSSIAYHIGGFPGFRSCSALYQEDRMVIVILTNVYDGPATNWLMAIKSILDAYANSWEEFVVEGVKKPDFSELTGYYQSGPFVVHISQIGDKLVSIMPENMNPLSTLIIFDHEEEWTFSCPREVAFAKIGETIQFRKSEQGEILLLESDNSEAPRFEFGSQ